MKDVIFGATDVRAHTYHGSVIKWMEEVGSESLAGEKILYFHGVRVDTTWPPLALIGVIATHARHAKAMLS